MKNLINRALVAEKKLFILLVAVMTAVSVWAQEDLARERARRADSIAQANRQAREEAAAKLAGLFSAPSEGYEGAGSSPAKRGTGSVGNGSWSLAGRDLVGRLPQPGSPFSQEGTVVVQIVVDKNGNVIEVQHQGGTISDRQTIQMALEAAKKAKFTKTKTATQVGTITYTFRYN